MPSHMPTPLPRLSGDANFPRTIRRGERPGISQGMFRGRIRTNTYTMMRLKYILVMVTLASWFFATIFTATGSNFRLAFSAVATAYILAVLFLALSALVRKIRNEELTFDLDRKFLLFGPTSLAAAASVVLIVDRINTNYCTVLPECLS